MADLYEDNILLWREQQAGALRRWTVDEIDWETSRRRLWACPVTLAELLAEPDAA